MPYITESEYSKLIDDTVKAEATAAELAEALENVTRYIDISTINQSKRTATRWGELAEASRAALARYQKGAK